MLDDAVAIDVRQRAVGATRRRGGDDQLNQLHEILDRRGGKLIGVNLPSDPPPTAISMAKKYEIAYPNALDVHGEINKALGGISVTPTHLFINREGKIVQRRE